MKIKYLDTTLRDGAQMSNISFSLEDKIKILHQLDMLGIDYIEGGWPGATPKDTLFFKKMKKEKLKHAKLVAFGSTVKKYTSPGRDKNICALLDAGVKSVCVFGKTWDFHVREALRTTLEENLRMIKDTIQYLKKNKMEVIYDAEHFFDGYISNPSYAIETLLVAQEAGSDYITLCDTNGGMLPLKVKEIVTEVKKKIEVPLGIHAHNDTGCAVANTIMAVEEGCELVHGTINGYGERCGNADLCVVIPNLQLKLGYKGIPEENLAKLTMVSRYVSEISNIVPNDYQPYVGYSAFAHKGGVHVSAVSRSTATYEHINPATVGNARRILVSEYSGKATILTKLQEASISLPAQNQDKIVKRVLKELKKKENLGYQYEVADGSFALILYKSSSIKHKPLFEVKSFRVIVEKIGDGGVRSEAAVKLKVGDVEEYTVAEGDGPVNALDNALRKALNKFYPELAEVKLTDFKVRVIDPKAGTAAKVRVLIESRDEKNEWTTIGVSENIIEASWQALIDSVEYKLFMRKTKA
jgi:2-isopropylmalate synthase